MEYENGVCLCKTGRTCACVYVRVCVHAHSKWLKSFAEAEHFDIVAGRLCAEARAFCSFHAGQLSGKERERGAPSERGGGGGLTRGVPAEEGETCNGPPGL